MITIAFYILTILLVITPVSSFSQAKVAGFVTKISNSSSIGSLFAGLAKWLIIEWLWFLIEGGQVPLTALVASFLYIAIRGSIQRNKLSESAYAILFAEQWSIVLIGIASGVHQSCLRWY